MSNNNYQEILKQGQIELNYTQQFRNGFRNTTAIEQIYPIDVNASEINFIAITNKGQIINTLDISVQQFQDKVHPFIVPFEGTYVALKTRNAREVVGLDGKVVAKFSQAVDPQITCLADGSFVALEKERWQDAVKIVSTSNRKYEPFSKAVCPILVPGIQDGEFHAILSNNYKIVLSNLYRGKISRGESLPGFKDNTSMMGEYANIIRLDNSNVFVTLTDDNQIIGTNGIIYGEFECDVKPESLVYLKNKNRFYALDSTVSEVWYRNGPEIENIKSTEGRNIQEIKYLNKKSEEYQKLNEVPRTVTIDTKKLEMILSGTDVKK